MRIRTIKTAILGVIFATASVVSLAAAAKDKPLSKAEVKSLIANAETKAEHERLAKHFEAEATRYEAEAKEHAELAQVYQQNTPPITAKYPGLMQTFQHCDSVSKALLQAAENARKLASEHSEMAKAATK